MHKCRRQHAVITILIGVILILVCGRFTVYAETTTAHMTIKAGYQRAGHDKAGTFRFYTIGQQTAFCVERGVPFVDGQKVTYAGDKTGSKIEVAARLKYLMDTEGSKTYGLDAIEQRWIVQKYIWQEDLVGRNAYDATFGLRTTNGGTYNKGKADALYAQLVAKAKTLDYVTGWLRYYTSSDQHMGVLVYEATGALGIVKASSDPSVTDGHMLYSLSGAKYGIYTDEACTKLAKKYGSLADAIHTVHADGTTHANIQLLPGTYYVKEIEAPEGYRLDDTVYPIRIDAGNEKTVEVKDAPIMDETLLTIVKVDAETGTSMPAKHADLAGAEFTVRFYHGQYTEETLPETADREVVLTTKKVTIEGQAVHMAALQDAYVVRGELYKNANGTNVLPLGTIVVEETKAPNGYELTNRWRIGDTLKEGKVVIPINGEDPIPSTLINMDVPIITIGTTASSIDTNDHLALAGDNLIIKDVVAYDHLLIGHTYRLEGILMDRETKKPILIDGKEIKATSGDFTIQDARERTGTITMTFPSFDARSLEGKTLVVGETLYDEDRVVAEHADLTDEAQTIYLPSVKTEASDVKTAAHIGQALEEMVLRDAVTMENLIPGRRYTVQGILFDKEEGVPFLSEGKEVRAEETFVASAATERVTLTFGPFNGSALSGHALVATEYLYHKEKCIGMHASMEDEAQSVYYPKVRTRAHLKKTMAHEGEALPDTVIEDVVQYDHLCPDKWYKIKGTLMDAVSKEPLAIDGKSVEAYGEPFRSGDDDNGEKLMSFYLDATNLAGRHLVVFEELLYLGDEPEGEGVVVAAHCDYEDREQSIRFVTIGTRASGGEEWTSEFLADEKSVIRDEVRYGNLVPGTTYTMRGYLIDKTTGNALDEEKARTEVVFTPEETDGTLELLFTADTVQRTGHELVVCEELYLGEQLLATHADLSNQEQTVKPISIGTTLSDAATGGKTLSEGGRVAIHDTVHYEGLTPGRTYTLKGVLYTSDDEAKTEMVGETTFVPQKPNGETTVAFHVDTERYAGRSLVAFEHLYNEEGQKIASHEDIRDEAQTVFLPKKSHPPLTGDRRGYILMLIVVGLGALVVMGTSVIMKKR